MSGVFAAFTLGRPSTSELRGFFVRVQVQSNGCWLWIGCVNGKGYGAYKGTSAHRFTYAWFVGPIPADHEVDHLCRVRLCVNPAHGEAVTGAENRRRANRFELTGRCKRGHVLSVCGVAIDGGERTCRECRRITQARYVARQGLPMGDLLETALMRESLRLARVQRHSSKELAS